MNKDKKKVHKISQGDIVTLRIKVPEIALNKKLIAIAKISTKTICFKKRE